MYLIFAAGKQQRWGDATFVKQLVDVGGEVLIERIQRQFPVSMVVTHDYKIMEWSRKWHYPVKRDSLLDSIKSTEKVWTPRTVILLGDVYYSSRAVAEIMTCEKELFFGDSMEIYAFVFYDHKKILDHINKALEMGGKKLWHLYRVMNDIPLDTHEIRGNFMNVDAEDFDNLEQYKRWAKKNLTKRT